MIASIAVEQTTYWKEQDSSRKKELGQYFTGESIADYMASMVSTYSGITKTIKVLDAGAGAGILSSALAMRCLSMGYLNVHAVLYELDPNIIAKLKSNMERLSNLFTDNGGKFSFEIRNEDFVLARPDKLKERFHFSSINPPYFKYNTKTSPYAKATADIYKGDPNIYVSFLAIVTKCLAPNGQVVAIIPRSFANGLYFKGFRNYLTDTTNIERIHIFRTRDRAFKELKVLQENVIVKCVKQPQVDSITVSSSVGESDLSQSEINHYPRSLIIDRSNSHSIIRVPETISESQVLSKVESWKTTFENAGYYISTGRIVDFRSRKLLTKKVSTDSVPLYRMQNVRAFTTTWTGQHKKDIRYLVTQDSEKNLIPNQNYLFVKRFSSKNEKRRLVAGVYLKGSGESPLVAVENHINYVGKENGLRKSEAFGLAGLLNSTFMDTYFRCISGNTQVNATEVRLLKLPARDKIVKIGESLCRRKNLDQDVVDSVVNKILSLEG